MCRVLDTIYFKIRICLLPTSEPEYNKTGNVLSRNIEARSRNQFWHAKSENITYSKCVFVALVIQNPMRVRRIILSSSDSLAAPYFPTLSHTRHYFRKRSLLNIKRVFWFSVQLLSETFFILRRTERDIIIKCMGIHVKNPFFLSF